ncbi:hypothetical protein Taro_043892 [Colocasia esculenta]|uniref:Uncharacterized protein n=1 Tax=Colocasia esculenta TaxID=4460 RepID=A0A843WM84_COLES|nr:hypothetical protein [Colocasia esculenta]
MTQCRCPNLIFPSAPESANSAANSSTLVAPNAPSKAPEDGRPRQRRQPLNRTSPQVSSTGRTGGASTTRTTPNHWLVTHDKPSKHEARTDPQEGRRPTKAPTNNKEPRNTTSSMENQSLC